MLSILLYQTNQHKSSTHKGLTKSLLHIVRLSWVGVTGRSWGDKPVLCPLVTLRKTGSLPEECLQHIIVNRTSIDDGDGGSCNVNTDSPSIVGSKGKNSDWGKDFHSKKKEIFDQLLYAKRFFFFEKPKKVLDENCTSCSV